INKILDVMLNLALLVIDDWSAAVGKVIRARIENPQKIQSELAVFLGKSQSSISDALKRGGWDEIMMLEDFYRYQISSL
ncbi:MAG: transcriptional regulator, partial [Bacteroidota bacterium]